MPYIDSRGAEMPDMSFSEALDFVYMLAESNLPDEADIAGDTALAAERDWQQNALNTVHDLVVNHHENIDDEFEAPAEYQDHEAALRAPDRGDDPSDPIKAIAIILQMANNAMPDAMTVQGIDEAETFDRNSQAIELTEILLGAHGPALGSKITAVRPSF